MRISHLSRAKSEGSPELKITHGIETIDWLDDFAPHLWLEHEDAPIMYLMRGEAFHETHISLVLGDEVVAMGGVQNDPHDPQNLWIKFISVDPEFQGRGYASRVLKEVFRYAASIGRKVAPGGFTEQGQQLWPLHARYEKEYPQAAFARDERGNYINDQGKIVRSADKWWGQ